MEKIEPRQFLENNNARKLKLCFYPSCGSNLLWSVMDISADIFMFSDYFPKTLQDRDLFYSNIQNDFQKNNKPILLIGGTPLCYIFKSGNKIGLIFFTDNNVVVSSIKDWNYTISTFIGITDGCGEGGNYECVNGKSFLLKILDLTKTNLKYFTDHSPFLENHNESKQRGHRFFIRHLCVDDRWEFELKNVLVVPNSVPYSYLDAQRLCLLQLLHGQHYGYPKKEELTAFNPSKRTHTRDERRCDILKLSPFRTRGGSIIAHYDITSPTGLKRT